MYPDTAEETSLRVDIAFEIGSVVLSGGTCIDFAVDEAGCCVGFYVWHVWHTLVK